MSHGPKIAWSRHGSWTAWDQATNCFGRVATTDCLYKFKTQDHSKGVRTLDRTYSNAPPNCLGRAETIDCWDGAETTDSPARVKIPTIWLGPKLQNTQTRPTTRVETAYHSNGTRFTKHQDWIRTLDHANMTRVCQDQIGTLNLLDGSGTWDCMYRAKTQICLDMAKTRDSQVVPIYGIRCSILIKYGFV